MRYLFTATVLLSLSVCQAQITRFEKTAGAETATYFEAIQWYKDLAKKSPLISIKQSPENTDAGYPLHLVLISGDKKFDPIAWHRQNKVVIMVNNGIHPGEPDGIDASMMLVRDIVKRKVKLPANVVLGFIPVYNIGGCLNRNAYTRANQNGPEEYGFRGNSQNLDLNRDFTKMDSRDAKAFTQFFHFLEPDVLVDNHVSDGADYQHTMTLISTQYDKLGPVAGKWLREKFEPAIYKNMAAKNWELIPYVDFETTDFDKGMRMFYDPPRYSSGYAALFNCFSFMPETHMLKPYKQRVQSTYDLMVSFINESAANADSLVNAIKAARVFTTSGQKDFPLKWLPDPSTLRQVNFKGYERDSAKSQATGLQKMFYNHQKPFSKSIKYFDRYKPADMVKKPEAYIIPQGWYSVIERLGLNGVKYSRLKNDSLVIVDAYHIDSYKSYPTAYEKHHKNFAVQLSTSTREIKFLAGDYIVYLNQPANRYIIEMLEPNGDDSFFSWNFFDAVLQQKEGYSDYRWEDIAAAILAEDSVLQQKLAEKKLADPKFAANSSAILDFIYRSSPYYEKAHLQYPVYRVEKQD
ncbi:MAG: hypothetical protein JWQ27_2050 [Ferruginibacter sp.]|nr:hypothetical protein [Ferruginibacter sp.]